MVAKMFKNDAIIMERLKNKKPETDEEFAERMRKACEGDPDMSEDEARQILRESMERPCKGKEWPKVWIGEVTGKDKTGYSFQAAYYGKDDKPGEFWLNWGVDARTKECMFALM